MTCLILLLEILLCMIYIVLCCWCQEGAAQSAIPPKPIEPTFSCPICMGNLVEEMSTKCGHIFCKICIKASIAAQGKCPTCRRKITIKDTIRVYLPATRWDNKGWSSYPNKLGGEVPSSFCCHFVILSMMLYARIFTHKMRNGVGIITS